MPDLQNKLQQIMTTLQLDDAPAGGSVVVYHQGELIAECNVGFARANVPWQANTLSLNYSTGKGVLVTLIHILVSKGSLEYDKTIAHYWQEFANNGKEKITLRDVLTHRADLFDIQSITKEGTDMLDWQAMLDKVELMTPTKPKNKQAESCYSALVSGWVLGGLIEKVTGLTLNEAVDKYLAQPLGVSGEIYFGVPKNIVSNVAVLAKNFTNADNKAANAISKRRKPTFKPDSTATKAAYKNLPSYLCWQKMIRHQEEIDENPNSDKPLGTLDIIQLYFEMGGVNLHDYKNALIPAGREVFDYYEPESLMAKIPAANNVATANALAKMYAMLANKGEWQGAQIIKPAVFEALATINVTGSDAIMAATNPHTMLWRLGYHRLFDHCNEVPTAFGHMGYNGSCAWCDVDRKLAVAFVHNYDVIMSTDIREFAIGEAIIKWIDEVDETSTD